MGSRALERIQQLAAIPSSTSSSSFLDTLTDLEPGRGYFVRVKVPMELVVRGSLFRPKRRGLCRPDGAGSTTYPRLVGTSRP